MGRRSIGVVALTLGVSAPAVARSATPDLPLVRLEYAAPEGCPDEAALRAAVETRLGQDPFAAGAPRLIRVRVAPTTDGYRADVDVVDERGAPAGSRAVEAATDACGELLDAVALAISIAIDPLAVGLSDEPAPVAPVAAPRVVTRIVRVREVVHPRPPPSAGPSPRIAVGALGSIGFAPDPTGAVRAAFELAWARFSVALEGRLDAPTTAEGEGDERARIALLVASAAACTRQPVGSSSTRLSGCLLLTGGALRGEGLGVERPRRNTVPYAALGVRAAGEIPVTGPLALALHVDAQTPLLRAGFVLDGQTLWTTPRLALAVGIAAVMVIQ